MQYELQRAEKHDRFSATIAAGAIILYVHLWVLEGALRKWVPGLGDLMYVSRDLIMVLVLRVVSS